MTSIYEASVLKNPEVQSIYVKAIVSVVEFVADTFNPDIFIADVGNGFELHLFQLTEDGDHDIESGHPVGTWCVYEMFSKEVGMSAYWETGLPLYFPTKQECIDHARDVYELGEHFDRKYFDSDYQNEIGYRN